MQLNKLSLLVTAFALLFFANTVFAQPPGGQQGPPDKPKISVHTVAVVGYGEAWDNDKNTALDLAFMYATLNLWNKLDELERRLGRNQRILSVSYGAPDCSAEPSPNGTGPTYKAECTIVAKVKIVTLPE